MTDSLAQRRIALTWGAVCIVLFAAIAALVVASWQPLLDLDARFGARPEEYTVTHEWARQIFLAVQYAFDFWPMIAFTVVTAALLFARNHRRAAGWTVGVMTTTVLAYTALKPVIERKRPVFDNPVTILKSFSFPSGHACTIASAAGVAIVLALMLVRRRELRRVVIVAAIAVAFLVGADRILLGVHNLSDVVGGWLLGAAVPLFWLAFFDPKPRSIVHTTEALPEVFPARSAGSRSSSTRPRSTTRASSWRCSRRWPPSPAGRRCPGTRPRSRTRASAWPHAAAVAGADLVIACGGDGTVRDRVRGARRHRHPGRHRPGRHRQPAGPQPRLPLYLRAAVDVALNGQDRAIDHGRGRGDKMEDATSW